MELRPTLTLVAVAPSLVAGDDLSLSPFSVSQILLFLIIYNFQISLFCCFLVVTYVYNSIAIQFRKVNLSVVDDDYMCEFDL